MLLSIALSYTSPSNITRSPRMYGLVLSGYSHSGITFGSGIKTFAHRLGAATGVQASCAACDYKHLYKIPSYYTLSSTKYAASGRQLGNNWTASSASSSERDIAAFSIYGRSFRASSIKVMRYSTPNNIFVAASSSCKEVISADCCKRYSSLEYSL